MRDQEEDFASLLNRYLGQAGFTIQELAEKIGVHRNTVSKWLNYGAPPTSRAQVLRIADELVLSQEERRALIKAAGFSLGRWPTEIWIVPISHDMFFTGREAVLQSLREQLVPGRTEALTQALSGLGGIGKTHTAVEYAWRFHRDYEAVIWLQAESWEILASGCRKLVHELELPEQKESDRVIKEVQRWLQKHRRWLLILDDVEDVQQILSKFVPANHHGSVLITTRVHAVEPLAQTQVLATMSEQEGTLFLLRRTGRIAASAGLELADQAQREEARQIWQLMGGLPLALDQVGAYILETGCTFLAYREQYSRRNKELLNWRGKRFAGHEQSVATTFSLAFERVEALNSVAADILRVCSFLASEPIPEELFQDGAEHLGPLLAAEDGNWNLSLATLQDYSLIQRNPETKTLMIHRLVQAVLQEAISSSERNVWAERVVFAMNAAFPHAEPEAWSQCERLLPHALIAAHAIEANSIVRVEAAHLLYETASYLSHRARYREAEPLFQRALRIFEQQLGSEDPQVAAALDRLALLYREQGKYVEAEPLYQRALRIFEQQLGPEDPQVATTLDRLASLYFQQGKYEKAEELYLRALRIFEQRSGPEHLSLANPLNNLAGLYYQWGKYAEAKPLFQRALRIWEQQLGPEHPNMAHPLNNLALLYYREKEYEKAEPLFQRAQRIWERQLGPEHPLVATALLGLADLRQEQGRYEEAEPLYQRALHIFEQRLGPEHPNVGAVCNNLAELYSQQGKYEEAALLFQRALRIWEKLLGSEHPHIASSLLGLAEFYSQQEKYREAEPLYQRALSIWEQQPGPEHPEMAKTIHCFASFQEAQNKLPDAYSLYRRALVIRRRALEPHHPDTEETYRRLIDLLHAMGRHEEAAQLEAEQTGQSSNKEERKEHTQE